MELRPYQKECIEIIQKQPPGSYLIQMPTGCGKTATFSHIPRQGRVLILSHREELVEQPRKYYDCSYGVERAASHENGEEVVSASVQTMVNRLDRFSHDEFDMIITDEAHHAAARTYRKIYSHFQPRLHLGFTATPGRADNIGLYQIYSKIIFQRDLKWAIEQGYLCDIYCKRVNIGYDLSAVHTRNGDYAPGELDEAMEGTADAIAEAYRDHATGATLIFAASVHHAEEIAEKISGAVVVTGKTKERAGILQAFEKGQIPAIVNCMVFTEGTDIPRVETVIIARPTQSESLYSQMVGRGLRLYPGKERLVLIDCVGITGRKSLCTAPSLLGLDVSKLPESKQQEMEGPIFDLPIKAAAAADCPESWIRNIEIVDLWAREQSYNLHGVNFFQHPDMTMTVSLPGRTLTIPPPNALGLIPTKDGGQIPVQNAIDMVFQHLCSQYGEQQHIWDLKLAKRWMNKPASEKQINLVSRIYPRFDVDGLTKGQASLILNRTFARKLPKNYDDRITKPTGNHEMVPPAADS